MEGRRAVLAGAAAAAAVVVLFSAFTLVSRLGTLDALRAWDLAALRFGVGGVLLLPVLMRRGLAGLSLGRAARLSFFGGLGFALLAYAGFARAPAAHGAVFLHGMLPAFGTLAGALWLGERPSARRLIGAGLILAGVAALALDALGAATGTVLLGDACLVGASACWSVYGVLIRRYKVDAVAAAAIVTPLSMAVYLPVYFLALDPQLGQVAVGTLAAQAVFQGVLIAIASLLAYTLAVSLLGATETAVATAAVPCLTTVAAIPLLGEMPGPLTWAGVAIASLGMVAALSRGKPKGDGR
jgi:drug/metabolite transporter (DMT)-like permease